MVGAYLGLVELVQSSHKLMNDRTVAAGVSLMQIDGTPKDKPPIESLPALTSTDPEKKSVAVCGHSPREMGNGQRWE